MEQLQYLAFILLGIMPLSLQSNVTESLNAVAESSNKFSLNLYKELRKTPGNIIVSPISAHVVLSLAYHGAVGKTAEEMGKTLQLPANKTEVLEGHRALLLHLENPVLKLATKMFKDNETEVVSDFQQIATNYYLSDVEEKDFQKEPEKSREEINSWVESKTNNKIKDLLAKGVVDSLTRIILVNAIHFKANWAVQFNKNITHEAPFYVTPTEPVNVQMMSIRNQKFRYTYSENLNAKIVELPYEGNEFSMILIVPEAIDGLSQVEDKLETLNLSDELSSLYETEVNLMLPRFKIEKTMDLNDILQSMGIVTAFQKDANFSKIANENLVISKVVQKAFVEVNEEGTEAAAATGLVFGTTSVGISHEIYIICDRPFIFHIICKDHNEILFMSRLNKP